MASDQLVHITAENFEDEVIKSDKPVLVDFWATWCGPCRMIAPFIDELAQEYEGKAKVGKVDVDAQESLAANFGVMSIPTIILFKEGKAVKKSIGAVQKSVLADMIDSVL